MHLFLEARWSKEEDDPSNPLARYAGFALTDLDDKVYAQAHSSDPEADFKLVNQEAEKYIARGHDVSFTSGVDHFVMDVPGFEWYMDPYGVEWIVKATPAIVKQLS